MTLSTVLADALAQKAARLQRCLQRAREEYGQATDFLAEFSRQDAAILNVQRACELAIDMGNLVIAHERWDLPASAREVFGVLQRVGVIDEALGAALARMVGFRNIAVHEYQKLDMAIVVAVIEHELDHLHQFAGLLLARYLPSPTP